MDTRLRSQPEGARGRVPWGLPQDLHHLSSPGSLLWLTPILFFHGPRGGVPATIGHDADAFLRPQRVALGWMAGMA